jgi:hypothetical protein
MKNEYEKIETWLIEKGYRGADNVDQLAQIIAEFTGTLPISLVDLRRETGYGIAHIHGKIYDALEAAGLAHKIDGRKIAIRAAIDYILERKKTRKWEVN